MIFDGSGSGRNHSQIATTSIVRSVNILTVIGALVKSIITPLHSIIRLAIHLAFLGTVPLARHARKVAPYLGCCINQSSIAGQPLDAAHAAKIKNTVVGIPGNNAPIKPRMINKITRLRQNIIFISQLNSINSVSIAFFSQSLTANMYFTATDLDLS